MPPHAGGKLVLGNGLKKPWEHAVTKKVHADIALIKPRAIRLWTIKNKCRDGKIWGISLTESRGERAHGAEIHSYSVSSL